MSLLDSGDLGEDRAYERGLQAGEEPGADSLAMDAEFTALIHNMETHRGDPCDCPLDLTQYLNDQEPW